MYTSFNCSLQKNNILIQESLCITEVREELPQTHFNISFGIEQIVMQQPMEVKLFSFVYWFI